MQGLPGGRRRPQVEHLPRYALQRRHGGVVGASCVCKIVVQILNLFCEPVSTQTLPAAMDNHVEGCILELDVMRLGTLVAGTTKYPAYLSSLYLKANDDNYSVAPHPILPGVLLPYAGGPTPESVGDGR